MSVPEKADPSIEGAHVSCLSSEVMTIIFGLLPTKQAKGRVACVCLAWRNIVSHPSLWRDEVHVWRHSERKEPWITPILSRRGIRHVVVRYERHLLDEFKRCPWNALQLEALEWAVCDMPIIATDVLLHPLPHLTKLSLRLCSHMDDEQMGQVIKHFPNLLFFELDLWSHGLPRGEMVADKFMLQIATGLLKLKHLKVQFHGDLHHFSDVSIGYLTGNSLGSTDGFPKLESLVIEDCGSLTNLSMKYLSFSQRSLTMLVLDSFKALDKIGMKELSKLPLLRKLVLTECFNINDDDMIHLAAMTTLRELHLNKCFIGDQGLSFLADGGSNITTLRLESKICTYGPAMTDEGLRQVARLTHLRELVLEDCLHLTKFTSQGFSYLSEGVAKISNLDVLGCEHLELEALLHISECMSHLRQLSVNTINMNNEGMIAIVRNLPHLTRLCVDCCYSSKNIIVEARQLSS